MSERLKLYWSDNYPENLYRIENGKVYALRNETWSDSGEAKEKPELKLSWQETTWSADTLTKINPHGFKKMGEI
jgi:hypothetical protein